MTTIYCVLLLFDLFQDFRFGTGISCWKGKFTAAFEEFMLPEGG